MTWSVRSTATLAFLLFVDASLYVYLRSLSNKIWQVWDYFWYLTLVGLFTIICMTVEGGVRSAQQGQHYPARDGLWEPRHHSTGRPHVVGMRIRSRRMRQERIERLLEDSKRRTSDNREKQA